MNPHLDQAIANLEGLKKAQSPMTDTFAMITIAHALAAVALELKLTREAAA